MLKRLVAVVPIVVTFACGGPPAKQGPVTPTTVVLISVGALRADRLGVYGGSSSQTDAIDAFGRESMVFDVAWTPVPLALPAHASMFTGLQPPGHRVRGNGRGGLTPQVPVVAEAFQRGSFTTAAFVGDPSLDRRSGLSRGFDHYDDLPTNPEGVCSERRGGEVVSRALAWLRRQPKGQPVFLFVHLHDPHAPYAPPGPFAERYAGRPYDGEVAYVDATVGALREGLDDLRRWQDAVVVLVAGHGESLGEHGEATHGLLLYEGVLRVPFLVRAPGLAPGRTRDPVSLVDVGPTLLARSGLPSLGPVDGVDVTAPRDAGRDLYAETLGPYHDHGWSGLRAMRRRGMKLIDGPQPELYDLPGDPGESRSLWPSPAGEALRNELHGLAARLARTPGPRLPDDPAREALNSLGYTSSIPETPADFGVGRPDPRSRIEVARELDAVGSLPDGTASEAIRRLDRLARREPGSNLVRRRLADARLAAGDHEGAIRDYREASRLGHSGDDLVDMLAEAQFRAGEARAETGDLRRARELLAQSGRLNPRRADVAHAEGALAARAGRLEDAVVAFRRATDVDPRLARAWFGLGLAQERLGRRDQAQESYRRFLGTVPPDSVEREHATAYLSPR